MERILITGAGGFIGSHLTEYLVEQGGAVSKICKCLKIPSNTTARIQEAHITIGHIICEIVEDQLCNIK